MRVSDFIDPLYYFCCVEHAFRTGITLQPLNKCSLTSLSFLKEITGSLCVCVCACLLVVSTPIKAQHFCSFTNIRGSMHTLSSPPGPLEMTWRTTHSPAAQIHG